jgi:hypothetical protein
MPDFDGPASFLAALNHAQLSGEFRDHAPRYPRRPAKDHGNFSPDGNKNPDSGEKFPS